MTPCDACRDQLLDHLYGLLEPAEAAAIDAHLAECEGCRAARQDAARLQGMFAQAAKTAFPEVSFVPPKANANPPSEPRPVRVIRRRTVQEVCIRWVVAAGLLLAVAGIGGPTSRDLVGYYAHKPEVDREYARVIEAKTRKSELQQKLEQTRQQTDQHLTKAIEQHDQVLNSWTDAEEKVSAEIAARPFVVDVRGPTSAVPGAPNDYAITVTDKQGKPAAVAVTAEIRDSAGKVYFARKLESDKSGGAKTLRVPAEVWTEAPVTADLSLQVSAVDPKTRARTALTEELKLQDPVFTTFLSTDKPMYQPGETLFFHSTTLDRTRFLPPNRDQNLRFAVTAPSGQLVPGMELNGLAKPARPDGSFILGPDGKPVRGVGTGVFALPLDLAGGEYTLTVHELPEGQFQVSPGARPLATRKFIVNRYTPDRLLKKLEFDGKSYGPGDVVQAKFDVSDQGKPLANAKIAITFSAVVDGQSIAKAVAPIATGPDGTAAIRFTLPNADDLNETRLSVTVMAGGNVETIVRRVPLATRKLTVEFFPEGGDLVAGVPNRVYFRATTTSGKPADIEGILTDGLRDIVKIETLTDADHPGVNQGLGSFTFTPQEGRRYAVRLAKPIGVVQPVIAPLIPSSAAIGVAVQRGYELPEVKTSGIAMQVLDEVSEPGKPIRVRLTSANSKRDVVVGAYIRSQPVAHVKATLRASQPTEVVLDPGTAKMGGVTRITVFEEPAADDGRTDLKPVAERLVYRNPGEVLKLSAVTRKSNGREAKAFVPGETVKLELAATTETGAPTAAILWAAVVNKSVLTMADEKTARLMPTHFLLGGEVQNPDELEHADFLLTDHPKAAESLDLLLGTQGWRRFAEQAPGQFRQRVPAEDADRLLVALGASGPVPHSWRGGVRRVFDEYWPKYEAAVHDLETAQLEANTRPREQAIQNELSTAEATYHSRLAGFGQTAADLNQYYEALLERRHWLPASLVMLLAGAFVLFMIRMGRPADSGERRPLAIGAIGLLLLAVFLGVVVGVTSFGNSEWVALAEVAPQPQRYAHNDWEVAATGSTQATAVPEALVEMDKGFDEAFQANGNMAEGKNAVVEDAAVMKRASPLPGRGQQMDRFGGAGKPGMAMPAAPMLPPAAAAMVLEPQAKKDGENQRGALRVRMNDDWAANNPNDPLGRALQMNGIAGKLQEARRWKQNREAERAGLLDGRQAAFGQGAAMRKAAMEKRDEKAKRFAADRDMLELLEAIPELPPLVVREYAHTRPNAPATAERTDFTETLLWQPVLVTPSDGRVSLEFALADAVAPYQVLVAGHTLDGRIGAITQLIEVRKPFALDPKLPKEISSTDMLDVPVLLTNATDTPLLAQFTVTPTGLTLAAGSADRSLTLDANHGGRAIVRMVPKIAEGELAIAITGTAGLGVDDSVRRTLAVVPDGFPAQGSHADTLEQQAAATITLPKDRVAGTAKVTVTLYPNTLSELQAGLEGLLREPYGCFEQSSTTNYPNVLISQYLEETNQAKPDISKRSKDLMDRGYSRLIGFECPKTGIDGRTGFEWFGAKDQQHEALTAYGLLQFTDMSTVYPVDAAMLQRTKEYLLAARNGKGGFTRNRRALDSFGGAPDDITNAYIVWAITESEKGSANPSDLHKELNALAESAKSEKDPYFLSLVANALLNRDRRAEGIALLHTVAGMQSADGSIPGATTSITRSMGRDLVIETTALAVLGFLKTNRNDLFHTATRNAMGWISQQRGGYGGFGSTQSTILALKALIEHARMNKRPAESGEFDIFVAGQKVGTQPFSTDSAGPIVFEVPEADTAFGDKPVEVEVRTQAKQPYPLAVAWECRTRTPNSSPNCLVKLTSDLDKATCEEGETLRLGLKVENLADQSQGMVIAIIGLPAGLKLPEDMKQLKTLTDRPKDGSEPTLSYWETRGRELILYWRGMTPKQTVSFGIDLIADIPGEYTGPASRAYLYYNADHKHWIRPAAVTIRAGN